MEVEWTPCPAAQWHHSWSESNPPRDGEAAGSSGNNCNQCEKRYCHPDHLKIHQIIHAAERVLYCDQCGKSFRWLTSLQGHLVIHSDARPYICHSCGEFQVQE